MKLKNLNWCVLGSADYNRTRETGEILIRTKSEYEQQIERERDVLSLVAVDWKPGKERRRGCNNDSDAATPLRYYEQVSKLHC